MNDLTGIRELIAAIDRNTCAVRAAARVQAEFLNNLRDPNGSSYDSFEALRVIKEEKLDEMYDPTPELTANEN